MSGIPSWAVKGAKVVCVDATPNQFGVLLTKGDVYTVRGISVMDTYGENGLLLEEVSTGGAFSWNGEEVGFAFRRFRPAITQSDDISTHFSHHLHAPQKIVERTS